MLCPKCNHKMIQLFVSYACDNCDNKNKSTLIGKEYKYHSYVWRSTIENYTMKGLHFSSFSGFQITFQPFNHASIIRNNGKSAINIILYSQIEILLPKRFDHTTMIHLKYHPTELYWKGEVLGEDGYKL